MTKQVTPSNDRPSAKAYAILAALGDVPLTYKAVATKAGLLSAKGEANLTDTVGSANPATRAKWQGPTRAKAYYALASFPNGKDKGDYSMVGLGWVEVTKSRPFALKITAKGKKVLAKETALREEIAKAAS